MKMKSMIRSKRRESKELNAPVETSKYPYGLKLDLRSEELKKLGLDISNLKVGGKVKIEAVAKVESIHSLESRDSTDKGISIQITDLAIAPKGGEDEFAAGFDEA